jgi:hypothetical protein
MAGSGDASEQKYDAQYDQNEDNYAGYVHDGFLSAGDDAPDINATPGELT